MSIRFAPLTVLSVVGCTVLATLALTHGQEAVPAKRLPAAPITPPKPTRNLARMKPLERQVYLAAQRGASWLDRMNQKKGNFVQGWLPALNQPLEGEPALRQAGAAFALARAARYLQDEGCAARAAQAILALLEDTTLSADKTHRHPAQPSTVVNRVSAASLLVLAINELPAAEDTLPASEQLCEFLRRQQQKDGSFVMCEQVAGGLGIVVDADQAGQFAGQALYALVRSAERKPAAWKLDVVRRAMPFYMKWWRENKQREFVLWHSAAYAEAFLATKEKAFAEAVLEMNDWLCTLQHERLDPAHPQWMGGFQNVIAGKQVNTPPDINSAICCGSLAEACRVTRQLGDLTRHERYVPALERGLQFLATLQYTDSDTQHFAEWYRSERLIGGFHASHTDGNLRLDYNQHAVSALICYLRHVAQVQ